MIAPCLIPLLSLSPFTLDQLNVLRCQHPLWAGIALKPGWNPGRSLSAASPRVTAYWCSTHLCSACAHVNVFLAAPGSTHWRTACAWHGVAALPHLHLPRGQGRTQQQTINQSVDQSIAGKSCPVRKALLGWLMVHMACCHAGQWRLGSGNRQLAGSCRRRLANRRQLAVN